MFSFDVNTVTWPSGLEILSSCMYQWMSHLNWRVSWTCVYHIISEWKCLSICLSFPPCTNPLYEGPTGNCMPGPGCCWMNPTDSGCSNFWTVEEVGLTISLSAREISFFVSEVVDGNTLWWTVGTKRTSSEALILTSWWSYFKASSSSGRRLVEWDHQRCWPKTRVTSDS